MGLDSIPESHVYGLGSGPKVLLIMLCPVGSLDIVFVSHADFISVVGLARCFEIFARGRPVYCPVGHGFS